METKVEWGILFAIVLNVFTLGYAAGFLGQKVDSNTTRIEKVEIKADISAERLARIDENVKALLESAREQRRQ